MSDLSSAILSDLSVFSKYARFQPDWGRRETWDEIVTRWVTMHTKRYPTLAKEIAAVAQFIRQKKALPSMRSLQFAGKPIELDPSRGYNCSYLPIDDWKAFSEIMFLLLGGTGVGYSVQFHHVAGLPEIRKPSKTRRYLIPDSREGWADAVKMLCKAYFTGTSIPDFDYGDIRPKGSPLKTAGGKAPGPEPLRDCLHNIQKIFERKSVGERLRPIEVHDICCYIADAVLAGGIRRSAMIALFSWDDEEMRASKWGPDWEALNPQRHRANNSAVALRHRIKASDFYDFMAHVRAGNRGEPGVLFSNNADWGTNPCGEIGLRPQQFCNLTEVNASDIVDQADLNERVRVAAFMGTLQASYTDFHYLRDVWRRTTEKDALLGIGMTGIASGRVLSMNLADAVLVARAENARVAALLGINPAARITCVKPSGTSSCVLGCSSGIHAWHDEFYIRRLRFNKIEPVYQYLVKEHPELCEDDYFRPQVDGVVSIPMRAPEGAITRKESALDLLERVSTFNKEWVRAGHRSGDNTHNVSATISVKDDEWGPVVDWMWSNRDSYNGITVLPHDPTAYTQAPFESISELEYHQLAKRLKEIDLTQVVEGEDHTVRQTELACSGGACEI
jgi:ribonucleoside-diphosphate reductase alpha chain